MYVRTVVHREHCTEQKTGRLCRALHSTEDGEHCTAQGTRSIVQCKEQQGSTCERNWSMRAVLQGKHMEYLYSLRVTSPHHHDGPQKLLTACSVLRSLFGTARHRAMYSATLQASSSMHGSLVLDGAGDATVLTTSEERKSFDVYDSSRHGLHGLWPDP